MALKLYSVWLPRELAEKLKRLFGEGDRGGLSQPIRHALTLFMNHYDDIRKLIEICGELEACIEKLKYIIDRLERQTITKREAAKKLKGVLVSLVWILKKIRGGK